MLRKVLNNIERLRSLRAGRALANPIYICLSVDFDPWKQEPRRPAHDILRRIYQRAGLNGRLTYLINPVGGMEAEAGIFEEICADGNEIGLHCHIERPILDNDLAETRRLIAAQKADVENFYRRRDAAFRARSFRSGTRAHSPALFQALADAGLEFDSTLSHLDNVRDVYGHAVDDRGVPRRLYYLDPADCKSELPGPAPLIEMPVCNQIPDLRRLGAALRPGEPLVIATFVHPYNFLREGKKQTGFALFYQFVLRALKRIKGAEFLHMAEAGDRWRRWHEQQAK